MFRLFILYIILTSFKPESTDRFNFPSKFYKLTIGSSTLWSVRSLFGLNAAVEKSTMYAKPVNEPCIQQHEKTLEYRKNKLLFQFTENIKTKKYFLTSIEILEGSQITFGTTKMKTGSSHISDVLNEYGPPDETLDIISSDSTYIYRVSQTKIEYSFSFNAKTKLVTSVCIESQLE